MKIYFLLTELAPGGAERVVLDLAEKMLSAGHSVSLSVLQGPSQERCMDEAFRKLGIIPFYAGMTKNDFLKGFFQLRRHLKEEKPDIFHAHLMHPNLLSRLLNLGTGIPLVNTVHIAERRSGKKLYFLLDGLSSFLCSAMTAVSDAAARFHEREAHLERGSIRTIRNGCDPVPMLSPNERAASRMHWVGNICSRVIGSCGRLDPQKGYDLLLRLRSRIEGKMPPGETWGLVILGDGPERFRLEEMIRNDSSSRLLVRLPGFDPEASRKMDAFDAFVMPSRYEGYGLVLAEAMNFGLPVVYNPVDSLPEVAEGYRNGIPADFTDPDKADETAKKIVDSVSVPRCRPESVFTRQNMADAYLELYRELLHHE